MSRGRRYINEPKLNIKKVIGVVVAIVVIIMFIIAIKNLLNTDSSSNNLVSTTYFLLNKDNKWGIIDNNAKTIIEPTYDDAIILPDVKKDLFICMYDIDYITETYESKVLNSKGEEIFTEYDRVNALENYDINENVWYEKNVLLVEKEGKKGLVNFDGEKLLNIEYDEIYTLKGSKDSIIIEKDGKKGLVNHLGKVLVETQYDEIKSLGEDTKLYIVKSSGKYGVEGVLDCKYQSIKVLNNKDIYCVKENGTLKLIDKDEKIVFNEKFDSIEEIKDNIIIYIYNNKYYAYDLESSKKAEGSYKRLKCTANDLLIAKKGIKYGIINLAGETKVETKYNNINYYEEVNIYELEEKYGENNIILNGELKEIAKGIISEVSAEKSYIKVWTEEGYKYYNLEGQEISSKEVLTNSNLFLSKQNGKYGFVDKEGNVVVDYIYDDAMEQNKFGYIAVKKDGLWGSINKDGKIILDTKYNLDDNLWVDFIGEYHVGEDINMIYYTNK